MKTNIFALFTIIVCTAFNFSLNAQTINEIQADSSQKSSASEWLPNKSHLNFSQTESNDQEVNAFTPNGDGINDVFMENTEIKVFNRWGKEVFHGTDGWDGKKNGKELPAGTYYYIKYNKDQNGDLTGTEKASVTIIRR